MGECGVGPKPTVRLVPQQGKWLTHSSGELKRNREDADKSKDQARHQASYGQPHTVASNEFRHFSPPSCSKKRRRGARGSPPVAPAVPKPIGIDTPGPNPPSANPRRFVRSHMQNAGFATHTDYLDPYNDSAGIGLLSDGGNHGLIQETPRL